MVTSISNPSVLVDAGHGAWNGEVNGKGMFDLSFEFLVERQNLNLEKIQSSTTVIVHSTLRDATPPIRNHYSITNFRSDDPSEYM